MLTPEELKQIRRISLQAGRRVDSLFAGGYRSAFKGQGMEFEEVRLYTPGDDVRHIDWNVTARARVPHIKEYREERELTILLAIDVSGSMGFGQPSKRLQMARVAGGLAYAAIRASDRVGLLAFSDHVEQYVPPRKSRGHAWRVIREAFEFAGRETARPRGLRGFFARPARPRTDVAAAADHLGKVLKRRSEVVLISDFLSPGDWTGPVRALAARHRVHALLLHDPLEEGGVVAGLAEVADAETGELRLIDLSTLGPRRRLAVRLDELRRAGCRATAISTDQDPFIVLRQHFERHAS